MEIFTAVTICIISVLLVCLCGYCCKRSKRGRVLHPPVTVTNTHITATPSVQPPYPIGPPHPMPQPMPQPLYPPGLGFNGIGDGYQRAPYPPYPPVPGNQNMIPHLGGQNAPPPSYSEAISQPAMPQPLISEHYAKQSPYNPNY
ncbi:hypothetical protein Trydic_g1958 [Trypoxylus dichotomus]